MTKLNIYIVEDEAILAALLKYTLRSMGHTVCGTAASYDEAVSGLRDTEADLVITDIMLKGNKTGIDIARYIKANLSVPFIFLSSIMDEEMILDAMSTGPVSFLKKPANKDMLTKAIGLYTAIGISGSDPSMI